VLLTARALDLERRDAAAARTLALQAAKLAPDLVPATVLAAHLGAEAGDARRAGKMLEAAWRLAPHPEIADLYAHLRTGESARDRLTRVRQLVRIRPDHRESALALARAALDAREFAEARNALAPLLERPTQRVATLMAELEDLEHADAGRAREWMGRALRAERDPAWTADGIVSNRWLPVSPVTGRLDAFAWKVPVAEIGQAGATVEPEAAPAALPSGESGAEDTEAEEDHPEAVEEEAAKPEAAPVASPAPPPAPSTAPAPSTPPPVRSVPRRAAAVIPLMRAPDDPGIDGGPDEPAVRAAGSPPRGPLD
jgi:HemY protein